MSIGSVCTLVLYSLALSKLPCYRYRTAMIIGLLLTGCSSTPPQREMPLEPPPKFTQPGGERANPDRWWQSFADPNLDSLMERALSQSFTLRAAWARLRQAPSGAG